jgi:hypothetical protein
MFISVITHLETHYLDFLKRSNINPDEINKVKYQPCKVFLSLYKLVYKSLLTHYVNLYFYAKRKKLVSIFRYFTLIETYQIKKLIQSNVEVILTEKHIFALRLFLESNDYTSIVFEDDVFFENEIFEKNKTYELLNCITPTFITYSSAYHPSELNIPILDFDYYQLDTPIVDTLAVYSYNRPMAEIIYSFIITNPNYRLLPADYLFNYVLCKATKIKKYFIYFKKSGVRNGSFDSKIKSLVQIND